MQLFNVSRQGSLILIAILLAQFNLPTALLGNYEQLLFLGNLLTFFWISGLVQGLLSHYPVLSEPDQKRLLFNSFFLLLGLAVGLFLLAYWAKTFLWTSLLQQDNLLYYDLFLVYLCLNFPTHLVENFLLLQKKGIQILLFGLFSFSLQLLLMVGPVYLGWDFRYSFYGLVVVASVKFSYLFFMVWQQGIWKLDLTLVKQWLKLSWPLVLYAILGGLLPAYDGWLVGYLFDGDEKMFAIFRYGARELPLALALTNAFSSAMLPEIATGGHEALIEMKRRSVKLFHLLFPLSLFLMLASDALFPLLFNEDFVASAFVFRIYLLVIISRVVFSSTILISRQDNAMITKIGLIELLVNILSSYILGQYFGIAGIAMGTLLAFSLEKILQVAYLHFQHKVSPKDYLDFKWFFGYSALLLLSFLWTL